MTTKVPTTTRAPMTTKVPTTTKRMQTTKRAPTSDATTPVSLSYQLLAFFSLGEQLVIKLFLFDVAVALDGGPPGHDLLPSSRRRGQHGDGDDDGVIPYR
jgi:hypothetical protein